MATQSNERPRAPSYQGGSSLIKTPNLVLPPLSQTLFARRSTGGFLVIPQVLLVTLAPTNRCFLASERDQAVAQDNTKAVTLIQSWLKIKEALDPSRGTEQPWNVALQEQPASFWAWMAWPRASL